MSKNWVVCLAIAGVLAASPGHAGKRDDTLRVASNVVPESIDSYFNATREGVVLSHHIWSYLMYLNPKTGEYEGDLATSWKWIDDRTLEVELRKDVKFHNGDPLTADDVVATLKFVSNVDNKVIVQQNVNWIGGAEKIDNYKVRIRTSRPFPAAIEYLSNAVPIYPARYYAEVGPRGMADKPIGSGPYKVTEVVLGKVIKLEKNAGYYQGSPLGQPSIGKIEFRLIPEQTTQLAEILSGGLDWIWRVPPDQAKQLAQMPNLTVQSTESMRIAFLQFAASATSPLPALKDVRVRRAISYAIDRDTMVKKLLGEGARVLNTLCFPGQFGCTDQGAPRYNFDPAKAKALLAEAGYGDGKLEFEVWSYRDRTHTEAIINYLRDVGIKANIRMAQYGALNTALRDGKAVVGHRTYGSYGIMDASATVSAYLRGDEDDIARDEQVIKWLEIADTSIDPNVRKTNYQKALARAAEESLVLPLFSVPNTYAYTKELDFTPYPDELARFYAARWK
jgi:peptide/nickel transport system substrate-binding protein